MNIITIKNLLLLEPLNTPQEILTKDQGDFKDEKRWKLFAYFAGLVRKKFKISLTSLHSIPLGLAQISSIVKEDGVSTAHIPFILDSIKRYLPDKEIEAKISKFDYDEVWLSVGSPEAAHEVLRYAKIVKKINSDTPIMVGGVLPSMYPDFFLKNEEIDCLIRGPAEVAVKQYVKNSIKNSIQGFCYKTDGKMNIAPMYAIEPDLSKIPPYDFEGLFIEDYIKDNYFCNLQASRGCSFNCPFCTHPKFWGLTPKYRPLDHIKKEMRMVEDYGCKAGYFIDSTFTLNKNWLSKFVDAFNDEGITIKFSVQTRADMFTVEAAKLLGQTEIKLVWFGGESGSPKILKRLRGKDSDGGREHIKSLNKALKIAKEYNFLCGSSWMIGLPGEDKNTIQESRKVIFDLTKAGMDICDIRILQIFPGTDYWEDPQKWGLKIPQKENITSINTPWYKYAGHETEELTSEEIIAEANHIRDDLLDFYLSELKNERKRRKDVKKIKKN
ncbi:MAG: B12-binding domain-containing radical SAM protein [Promethearchaeota archaeon]